MRVNVYFQEASRENGSTRKNPEAIEKELKDPKTTPERKKELMRSLGQTQIFLDEKRQKREILKNRESFEAIRTVDLLALKRSWAPLYEYLLIDNEGGLAPIKQEELKIGKTFQVNFGQNKDMKSSLGAGDILPPEVDFIEVNGKKWERKNIGWRPGYYTNDGKVWKYLPIYDGNTIKIISTTVLTEEQKNRNNSIENTFFQRRIAEDIIRSEKWGKNPRTELQYLSEEEYKNGRLFAEKIKQEQTERNTLMPKMRHEEDFMLYYGQYLDEICQKLDVPQSVMMVIFRKESRFRSDVKNGMWSSAYGFGQIIDTTWVEIQNKHLPSQGFENNILDRNNPKDQILASTSYIAALRKSRGSLEWALMGYFWVSKAGFTEAKEKNPKIYEIMEQNNLNGPEGFEKAYILWLGLNGVLPSAYDQKWKNQLDKEPSDSSRLPYWLSAKISPDGSTWCGFTARMNAEAFRVTFPQIYNSSETLTQYSTDNSVRTNNPTLAISHAKEAGANVIDIAFENSKWSSMWHRACGVQWQDGKWYVYDPYFALGRNDKRTAVPYDTYMQEMISVQKKTLVWIGLHKSQHTALKQN
jgi:hypothetical protein